MIESIPNVSEGRRAAVVERLADAVRTSGARLLDYSADPSHNRSVFTLAGDPPAVAAAILALFTEAMASIDLRAHAGEHPRIGAVDVVPFVPLEGVDDGRVCSARKAGGGGSGQPVRRAGLFVRGGGRTLDPSTPGKRSGAEDWKG